jgi:hypothetical protein
MTKASNMFRAFAKTNNFCANSSPRPAWWKETARTPYGRIGAGVLPGPIVMLGNFTQFATDVTREVRDKIEKTESE